MSNYLKGFNKAKEKASLGELTEGLKCHLFDSQSLVCSKGEIESKEKTFIEFQAKILLIRFPITCVFEGGNRE